MSRSVPVEVPTAHPKLCKWRRPQSETLPRLELKRRAVRFRSCVVEHRTWVLLMKEGRLLLPVPLFSPLGSSVTYGSPGYKYRDALSAYVYLGPEKATRGQPP